MARAQEITDRAFEHILGFINPDRTEIEVALELEFYMRKLGAEGIAFETIAVSGDASSLPHGVPRDVKLKKGFFTMDFGAKFNGYCADMTRTVVIGKADEDIKKVYNTVLSAQTAVLDVLGEGMLCREADKIARDIIYGAGYEGCFGHSLGHGVGMFIHESPRLASVWDKPLEVGNIVTVEPGIYIEGKYGVRIEDMVWLTENGAVNLTKAPKDLIEMF
jgi:Xaa-Pro aminopeptidase